MSSLTSCLKKAGTALRAEDKAAVLALSRQFRSEGMSPNDAAIKAIDAQISHVGSLMAKEQELLTAPTKEEVIARQDQVEQSAKEAKTKRRAEADQAAAEDDRKRIAQASEAAAGSFELGGDAMANLTGQKDIFAEHEPVGKTEPAKIEDAGQKIGGARKDKWKDRGLDLTDLDGMSESEGAELATKANVWKPDYEAMSEAAEPVTAAMVKTVYDQLAAQPKKNTPDGRRNYVTMMQAVRKAYLEAKSPQEVRDAGSKIKTAIGLYSTDPVAKAQAREVLFSVYKGRSDPFVMGGYDLMKAKKMVEDGFPAKGEPWKKRLSLREYGGKGITPRGIELTLKESAELGTPLTTDQIVSGYFRISNKDGKAVGYAPTRTDAEAAAKTIYERDLKAGPDDKPEPTRPNLDRLKRENLPNRLDRDATAEDFVKDFGFRGVEFGNWAAQDERQRIINMAYDGLMDLAEIMGVPAKALSLNGTMGMAFGARGGGKFAAHYEPGKLVINMTKINGGGSMAHEWAHALDHYFGELNQKDAYTTKARGASGWYDEQQYKGLPITRMEKDAQGKWANVTKMRLANLRPEMAKAFDDVMSTLFSGQESKAQMVRSEELAIERYQALANKETDPQTKAMYQRGAESRLQALDELRKDPEDKMYPKGRSSYAGQAQALSGKSTSGYWTRPTEMFARAFESWVFDKVTAMGARSDYLVHGVEEDRFAGGNYKGNPYPTGAERATINAAFDKLASTIQTKETEKGVAMFARSADEEAFRRAFGETSGMQVPEVQKAVDAMAAKWENAPTIKVVERPTDLPIASPSDARGLIHNGTIYIVARNHRDSHGVAKTLSHEAIGHLGLWEILGEADGKKFTQNIQLAVKSGNKPLTEISKKVRSLYVDKNGKFTLTADEEAHEIAAFAVESAIDSNGNFNPGFGFFKQVWAKVAQYLRSIGIDVKFTNAELQGMLVSSMKGLETGHRMDGGAPALVAAARSSTPSRERVAPVSRSPSETPLYETLRQLSRFEDAFQLATTTAKDLNGIATEMQSKLNPDRRFFEGGTSTGIDSKYNRVPTLAIYHVDSTGHRNKILDIFNADSATPYIQTGNEALGQDVGGAHAYQMAFAWAHNNGKRMIPDPAGLTPVNRLRRTEAMISSALHFGTTEHMEPHQDQYVGLTEKAKSGTEPESLSIYDNPDMYQELANLKQKLWTNKSGATNIATNVNNLISASNHLSEIRAPEIRKFEFVAGEFKKRGVDGALTNDSTATDRANGTLQIGGERIRAAATGVGWTTIKRFASTSSVEQALQNANGSSRTGRRTDGQERGVEQRSDVLAIRAIRETLGDLHAGAPDALKESLYARGAQQDAFAPNVWNTPDPTHTDKLIYELQDGRVDLKRVQQAIEKSGQKIAEKWDARLAETLYPGRVAYRSQQFLKSEAHPLLKAMATYGVPMDELADYLHARGAKERNAQVAKVNPDMPDGGAGKNTKGVLMTNDAARDYLDTVTPGRKQILDSLAARVDAITAGTRTLLVTEGLEKQETIDAWTSTYKNYVPMFRDEAQSGAPHPQGSGFSVKGSASKRATGSTKEVTNILAHVLMQREAAITRAEKNRVALSLYGQALSHPNPEFWTTIKPSMPSASIAAELVKMGVDPATAAAGMDTVPTVTTVDQTTGKKIDRPNPLYKSLPGAIPLKVNGEDRVLMLNVENERGARLAENLKNLDGLTKLDLAGSIVGKSTRWLASVNTQYNPAFGLVNLTRDTLGGAINLGSTDLRGNSLKVLAQTPAAIFGIARELASGGQTGKWQTLYRQFQADGGQTGYKENFRDANDRAKAVEQELADLQRAGTLHHGRAAHAIMDLLDGFNTTLENAVRLSAYKAGLDKGLSGAQAARLGRELTVDFNRKGRAGREIGPLYAFFNASVQGVARGMETLKGPTGAKVIAGGLGLGIAQAIMLAAAGYDDDEIPEFVKTRSLIIPLLGKEKHYIAIPYPLELVMIPNTGRVLAELVLNGGKDIGKRTFDAIGTIAGSFNPLGGGNVFTADGALKTVARTLIDPLIELGFNKNFAGNTIEKASYGGESDNRPGAARAKESTQRSTTGQVYLGISKALNSMTGGTDYEAGKLSPTPERLRYIAQTVGGGVLREIEKTINASTASSRGEKVKMSQIPVAGRFYGEVDGDQVQQGRYFENSGKLKKLESSATAMRKSGNFDAADAFEDKNPAVDLLKEFNHIQRSIAALNKEAVQVINDPKEMALIDQDRQDLMRDLNESMAELEKDTVKPTIAAKIKGWRKEPVAHP